MTAVLLVAWVVVNISAMNTARHELCDTVLIPLFQGFSVPCIPLPRLCHLPAGMDCMPNVNTRGSHHPPSAPRSPHWARSCVHLAPSCTVCFPPGSLTPAPHQLPSALLCFPGLHPALSYRETERYDTQLCSGLTSLG